MVLQSKTIKIDVLKKLSSAAEGGGRKFWLKPLIHIKINIF